MTKSQHLICSAAVAALLALLCAAANQQTAVSATELSFDVDTDSFFKTIFRRAADDIPDVSADEQPSTSTAQTPPQTTPATSNQKTPNQQQHQDPFNQPRPGAFVPPFGQHLQRPFAGLHGHPPASPPLTGHQVLDPHGPTTMPGGMWRMPPLFQQQRNQQEPNSVFSDGLGKRLMSMLDTQHQNQTSTDPNDALRNDTLIGQLNKGMHSVYNNLSKMWNSTVQQQLSMLQESIMSKSNNSNLTPLDQARQQQVPSFFKNMASRIQGAQESLNKAWKQVSSKIMNATSSDVKIGDAVQVAPQGNGLFEPGNFFSSVNAFGVRPERASPVNEINPQSMSANRQSQIVPNLNSHISNFWNTQVAPQLSMVGSTIARTWRDLSSGGVFSEPQIGFATRFNPRTGQPNNETLDSLLEGIELNGTQYSLDDGQATTKQNSTQTANQSDYNDKKQVDSRVSQQFVEMQREINKMWLGLTNSLQSTIDNARATMQAGAHNSNLMQPFDFFHQSPQKVNNNNNNNSTENQVRQQLDSLKAAQINADMLHSALQQQENQNKLKTMEYRPQAPVMRLPMPNFNQMPVVGAVRDFWHQFPNQWDNFIQGNRQPVGQSSRNSSGSPAIARA